VMIDLVQFRWRLESPGDPKNSFLSGKTKAARELRLPKKVLTVSSAPAQTSGGTVNA
jgi:hypothetical protein